MSVDTTNWGARKRVKYSLLRRAFEENRGGEVILLIQWRLAQERCKSEPYAQAAKEFERENMAQPRSIRALNLIMKEKGMEQRYTIKREKADVLAAVKSQPFEEQIRLPRKFIAQPPTAPANFGIRPKSQPKDPWDWKWSDSSYEANTAIVPPAPDYKH